MTLKATLGGSATKCPWCGQTVIRVDVTNFRPIWIPQWYHLGDADTCGGKKHPTLWASAPGRTIT